MIIVHFTINSTKNPIMMLIEIKAFLLYKSLYNRMEIIFMYLSICLMS